MAFFGKKKRDTDESYSAENGAEGFVIHFEEDEEEQPSSFFSGAHKAPHAITIDEVLHSADTASAAQKPATPTFTIPMSSEDGEYSSAAKNLMNKMMKAKQAVEEASRPAEPEPATAGAGEPVGTAALEEATDADEGKVNEILAKANEAAGRKSSAENAGFANPDFLEKLKGFLNDDENNSQPQEAENETYTLDTVESILQSIENRVKQRNGEDSAREIDINYGVPEKVEEEKPAPPKESEYQPKVTRFDEAQEPIQIDVVHIDPADDDLESTRPVPLSYQYSFADEDLPNTDIETAIGLGSEADEPEGEGGDTIQFKALGEEGAEAADRDIYSSAEGVRENIRNSFRFDTADPEGDATEEDSSFEEEFEDYSCTDDAPQFKRELNRRCSTLLIRIIPTAILTLLMGITSIPSFIGAGAENAVVFRVVSLVLFGATLLINLNTVLGIAAVFRGQPDMDSPIGITAVLAFVYSCAGVLQADTLFLGAPIGLVLLAVNLGKYLMEKRIRKDFNRIANSDGKLAVKLIDEHQNSAEIAKGAGLENVLVCGTQKTVNITGFFKKCYAEKPYERFVPGVLIAGGAVGLLAAAISFVLSSSVVEAIGCMLAVFTLFCPPTYYLLNVLPFISAAKDAADAGALLCGPGGAENISEVNAVVFNADQLFPAGTVNLYQMKILSPNPIDQAIVEAAAVATAAKSPLADMFNRMAQGREDIVSDPVDAVNLEGHMGISGWIKDRRILIGNRLLMETHGISIPPVTVDRNILEKGFFPVYVACAGVPCALFVVGYNVDRKIKYELQRLCNTGAVILINSTDPNISEEMISDYFGIYRESVRLMNAVSLNVYKNAVNYQESFPASGLYNGSAEGLACLLTASVRLNTAVRFSLVLNFVFIALGALLCCYSIFTGGLPAMAALAVMALHLLNAITGALIPAIYKP